MASSIALGNPTALAWSNWETMSVSQRMVRIVSVSRFVQQKINRRGNIAVAVAHRSANRNNGRTRIQRAVVGQGVMLKWINQLWRETRKNQLLLGVAVAVTHRSANKNNGGT